jgi:exonuclease SbcD
MRFLHTADWHIGRQFHNVSLLEDQAHVLEQIVDLAGRAGVEALVVAGDVYDRAVPPADAVRLLSDVLSRLVLGLGVPVIMIAGNHDSPERLGFAAGMLADRGLHIAGPLVRPLQPVVLGDAHGPVSFYPIPYAEPAVVRERFQVADVHSHNEALGAMVAGIAPGLERGRRAVAVAHCFAVGGEGSESERPLTVGGAENVEAAHFSPFRYTALGHLHRPQRIAERVRYAGSLLKYSFSEASHEKSVTLVEIDGDGACRTEQVPLSPRRDLRIVEGALADILAGPRKGESAEDYLLVRLTDRHAILDAMGQLRAVYPNVLHLERPGLFREGELRRPGREQLGRSERALFGTFFEQVTGDPLDEAQAEAFGKTLGQLRALQRETAT